MFLFLVVSFFNWGENQPEEDKSCAIIESESGLWSSVDCNISQHVVCKAKPNGILCCFLTFSHLAHIGFALVFLGHCQHF